ncbi:glycoside hydrolase family 3 C-terminal domain-containing protein [uncultured Draconibacterium sp.]|uniref:glycoside hydrolase family 3 protein n=1 Tax=uncultured Draconibacterium sp. TaxID=1573823 RepID=UPI0029C888DB|nr:glycoside hydrolase family 3 C-terminal domain-containing protein [uncultured Draconibacterium sp.]
MKTCLLLLIFTLSFGSLCAQTKQDETPRYFDLALDFETRAADLVQHMTLDEKIDQLGNKAPAIPRLGILEYDWWNEALHGVARAGNATVFPQAIGMAATFDTDMMKQVADIISDEARAKHHEALRNNDYRRYRGLTFWSPNINIFRDPRWGRGHETYGEDPYLTGQMGIQFVKGLQGDDPKYLKLVATAKHYAVHNGPEPERHVFNVVPNARDLWETYLPAFKDLMVDAKAYSLMGAYNRVDGESSCASWLLLEDILRNKWGFEGYVVSDCGAIRDIHKFHKIVNTPEEAAAIGVRKGCDLNCGSVYQTALKKAIELGYIDEGELDLSVYRLMLARMKLGMFDPPEMVPFAQIPFEKNDCEAHDEVALKMAQKTMTLLKNDGVLPLNKRKIKRIAVVGPNADNPRSLLGNYAGTPSHPVTVINGIKNAVGKDIEVTYSEGVPMVIYDVNGRDYPVVDSKYLFTIDEQGEKVQGLTGHYFNNMNLEGEPALVKVDSEVKFKWGRNESPTTTDVAQGIISADKAINADNFSVRWTGKLVAPMTGEYSLGASSDDGCRLYFDGKLIANGWFNHGKEVFFGDVELEKGKAYDITLEFYDNTSGAEVNLIWITPEEKAKEKTDPSKLSKETLADVKKADVAIFVGGLDATWEGEEMGGRTGIDGFNRGDRTKIELPKTQMDALKAMKETGTPVIFVLMSGSAMSFDGLENELDAILMAWYPGQRGGDAVADVLFGDYNPAGRLPVTFYSSTDELADFTDYNMHAGKGFTYRYYTGDALYPFGHGLSYTKFEYSNLKIDKTSISKDGEFLVSVQVQNTGELDGEEVVQLYTKDVESEKWMALKQLRKFERVALKKGEAKTVAFKLKAIEDLRYYDPMKQNYMVEPGSFEIQIGASSGDIRQKGMIVVE